MQNKFRKYYYLIKPGIVRGNAITTSAGYFFGAGASSSAITWVWLFTGSSLVIASACVLNNILDVEIDRKMKRTKKRALVTGDISIYSALTFASVMIALGLYILNIKTTPLAALAALTGWFLYFVVYTYSKRVTVHGTLIGALSGATPPVIGYLAATNRLDATALVLFLILAVWQMPHFYAIAIFRKAEYKSANIPLWSVVHGNESTKKQIILYTILFIPTVLSLGLATDVSISYIVIMGAISLLWLKKVLHLKSGGIDAWAKGIFKFSLLVLLVFSVTISLDAWLP